LSKCRSDPLRYAKKKAGSSDPASVVQSDACNTYVFYLIVVIVIVIVIVIVVVVIVAVIVVIVIVIIVIVLSKGRCYFGDRNISGSILTNHFKLKGLGFNFQYSVIPLHFIIVINFQRYQLTVGYLYIVEFCCGNYTRAANVAASILNTKPAFIVIHFAYWYEFSCDIGWCGIYNRNGHIVFIGLSSAVGDHQCNDVFAQRESIVYKFTIPQQGRPLVPLERNNIVVGIRCGVGVG